MNQAAKGIRFNQDVLTDLLESIQHFVGRLDIYTQISLAPAMIDMVVKIIVELISTLVFW